MPRVLQLREARELDRKSVLSTSTKAICQRPVADSYPAKAFEKWTQAYKTKLELKAVA